MITAISACVIGGQIVLLSIGGQPLQEETISSIIWESNPEMVSVNRVTERPRAYEYRKDSRWRKNTKANNNRNKWKSNKRRQK